MYRYRIITEIVLFAILAAFFSVPAADAQEIPLPEEEAPTSLMEAELGDAEVDLFLEGSWSSSITGGIGWSWDNRSDEIRSATLPEMASGFSFQQSPSLTLSLWMFERFFFETEITEEEKLETYLFGYNGKEGEFVQKVRIGNTDLGFGTFGFLSLPRASTDSFGAYGLFETESSEHHLAARFDPTQKELVRYRGRNRIEETRLGPNETVDGRFFILPDKDIDTISVYIEDGDGSIAAAGTSFRKFKDDEVTISKERGLVFLTEPARGKLLVQYEKGGTYVGESGMGLDAIPGTYSGTDSIRRIDLSAEKMDFNTDNSSLADYLGRNLLSDIIQPADLGDNNALILYQPGQWSPFELRSVYDLGDIPEETENAGRSPLRLVPKGGSEGQTVPYVSFEEGLARVTGGDTIRSHESRYLFLAEEYELAPSGGGEPILYGPNRQNSPAPIGKELLYEKKTPVGSFNLGSDVLEGSVEVLRNGVPERRYSFNPETGELNFFVPIGHKERLEIRYRETGEQGSGELLAASTNELVFSQEFSGDLNLGLRWNVSDASYTKKRDQATGSILVTGGSSWRGEKLELSVDGGVSVESPNTTGLRRFLGMNGEGVPVSVDLERLYPAAPGDFSSAVKPAGAAAVPDLGHTAEKNPSADHYRGKLFYKDMYASGQGGTRSLKPYTWDPPLDQVYDYGERVGPYPAATGSETSGDAMVLEYELENEQWAGGLIPLVYGEKPLDLSRMESITLKTKHIGRPNDSSPANPEGEVEVYLLFGTLPEDLDSDGKLDQESSPTDNGFSFDHTFDHTIDEESETMPVAPRLPWAPQESMVNSEDLNGNGVLDGPGSGYTAENYVVSLSLDSQNLSGSWQSHSFDLSAAEKKNLDAVTAVQLVVVKSGASTTEASGRLLVSELSFLGSSFSPSEGTVAVQEEFLYEGDTGTGTEYSELTSFAEAELFNETGAGKARVASFSYSSGTPWGVRAYGSPVDLGDYRRLSFFMNWNEGASSVEEVTLSLQNPSAEGLKVRFDPKADSTGWQKYTWELESPGSGSSGSDSSVSGRILKNGEELETFKADYSSLEKNSTTEGVNRLDLRVESSGSGDTIDARLEVDEVHFHDSTLGFGGGGRSTLSYSYPGLILGSEEHPILRDFSYENRVQLRKGDFASGFLEPAAGMLSFSNDLSIGILSADTSLFFNGTYDSSTLQPTFGYEVSLPLFQSALNLEDSYSEYHGYGAVEVDHRSSLSLSALEIGSLSLSGILSTNGETLERGWRGKGTLSVFSFGGLDLSSSFNLDNELENNSELFPDETFGSRILSSYELYYPEQSGGERTRSTEQSLDVHTDFGTTRLKFGGNFLSRTLTEEEEFSLKEAHSLDFNADVSLAPESRTNPVLSFSYKRTLSTRAPHPRPAQSDFLQDLDAAWTRASRHGYFLSEVIFIEFYTDSTRKHFFSLGEELTSASYTPTSSLSFTLTPGSRLYNLVLPSHLELNASRTLERSYDSTTDSLSLEGTYRATALNLFGAMGRYSLFDWYRTGEITHSAAIVSSIPLSETMSDESRSHSLDFGQFLELTVSKNHSLTADTSYELSLPERSHDLSVETGWTRRRSFERDFPFKDRLELEETPSLRHEETFDVHWSLNEEEQTRSSRFVLSHATSLLLGERGEARAFLRAGYEGSRSEDEEGDFLLHTISGELGIEVKLSF